MGSGGLKLCPTQLESDRLSKEFDRLFSTQTGYDNLDERIKKTKAQKDQLLLVLESPFLPLHNNDSELGTRGQARKRDISFHTMSLEGTEAKDTFMTLMQTAKNCQSIFITMSVIASRKYMKCHHW